MRPTHLAPALLAVLSLAGCVQMDPKTGETIPRGEQRFKYDEVKKRAKGLEEGMTRLQVLLALGSPAEKSEDGAVWIYLPERPGILIPADALRLEFQGDYLKSHGYRPILLGQEL